MTNQMDARWKIRILRDLTRYKWKLNRCLRVNHSPISGATEARLVPGEAEDNVAGTFNPSSRMTSAE